MTKNYFLKGLWSGFDYAFLIVTPFAVCLLFYLEFPLPATVWLVAYAVGWVGKIYADNLKSKITEQMHSLIGGKQFIIISSVDGKKEYNITAHYNRDTIVTTLLSAAEEMKDEVKMDIALNEVNNILKIKP